MKIQPEKSNTQQGYILVVALIAMLFVGAIFIASSNRSGTEERVATSQLHAASLESAIYAGMYRVEKVSGISTSKDDSADTVCEAVKNELIDELLDIEKTFQAATDNNPAIYWKLVKLGNCKDYTGSKDDNKNIEKEFQFNLIAWQGNENKPISRLIGEGKVLIKDMSDEAGGIVSGLAQVLGANAGKTSGTLTLTGGAKIDGNVAANKIVIKGGAEITGEETIPTQAIKVDPLGLEKAMNESFYTDQDDKKIPFKNLPKTSVRDAFAKLEHGQKKEMGQWPFQRAEISPEIFKVYNADWRVEGHQEVDIPIYSPVSFLSEDVSLRVFDDFKINSGGSDPSLKVSGGRVVLFIDGDVEMNGGASMQIDSDSSLTLIVTGEFKLTGGFEFLNKNAVNDKGEPLFTLLSTYTGKKEAVKIAGGTKLYGVVYALSDLKLGGSGTIVGQAFGANINANGGTGIQFQSAFPNSEDAAGSDGVSVELDSDFEIIY